MKTVSVFDLPPTIVRELLSILMTRKNWNILTKLQVKRLNGALNRAPVNFYDRIWNILQRAKGGIIVAGHHLPQDPTIKTLTQNELTFSYQVESMMSDVPSPEHRQLLVELFSMFWRWYPKSCACLAIVATIMERNPEVIFVDALDCDKVLRVMFLFVLSYFSWWTVPLTFIANKTTCLQPFLSERFTTSTMGPSLQCLCFKLLLRSCWLSVIWRPMTSMQEKTLLGNWPYFVTVRMSSVLFLSC